MDNASPSPLRDEIQEPEHQESALQWVRVSDSSPYFVTEDGQPWPPIGHNDALAWVTLKGLYGRRDMAGIEAYLSMLARHGVTVLRVMMEYAQSRHRYFEKPCEKRRRKEKVQAFTQMLRRRYAE